MTETSVTGNVDSLLTVVATRTISGGGFSPSPSSLTLTFDDGGLSSSFTTLPSSTSVSTAAPEMSTWSMLLAGFAGLGALGFARSQACMRRRIATPARSAPHRHIARMRA